MSSISPISPDVVILLWPEEDDRRPALRMERCARLLLVARDTDPPAVDDPLEDWVRMPVPDADMRARVVALQRRAESIPSPVRPRMEGPLLRYRDGWVALSPTSASVVSPLVESFGTIVSADELYERAWPAGGGPIRAVLNNRLSRLRRQLQLLGLDLTAVRGEGYLLEEHLQVVHDRADP